MLPFLDFANTRNSGVAFGLAGDVSPLLIGGRRWSCWSACSSSSLRPGARAAASGCPPGLLVGGALGNLADRVRDGAVTDFIDLPAWPTFNLADVAIVAGVLLLVLLPGAGRRSRAVSPMPEPRIVHEDETLAGRRQARRPGGPPGALAQGRRPWSTCSAGLAGGGESERPGIVHRLDKDTSGLMVVARNDEAHRGALARRSRRGR